jgi:sterol desaturase/sphingolipid hydroxylase (fatty acid hydroxylase superfamily)
MGLARIGLGASLDAPRGSILKSVHGIPAPSYPPAGVDLAREARTARSRFYPVTAIYTAYFLAVLPLALRRSASETLASVALGIVLWTWVEYLVHRFVLHGRFPDGASRLRHALHRFFDTMHGDHHQRPWDGMHINGFLDTLPFAILLGGLSFLCPLPTAPTLVATLLLCYVVEEWVHYSVHFHHFRGRYFEYIRRHHLYHHSPHGRQVAFGLSNGVWDFLLRSTRIPEPERVRLYGRADLRLFSGAGPDRHRSA